MTRLNIPAMSVSLDKWTQSLCEFSRNIQAVKTLTDTMWRGLNIKLEEPGTPAQHMCCTNKKKGTHNRAKPPRFDKSTSLDVFCQQFEVMARHKDWMPLEKAT
jgi:hypothetical protein